MRWVLVSVYLMSVLYVHFRGKVRLPIGRQLFDHSTFMAPINMFIHMFSRVPATPYHPVSNFPELAPLAQQWRTIRAEAEQLSDFLLNANALREAARAQHA